MMMKSIYTGSISCHITSQYKNLTVRSLTSKLTSGYMVPTSEARFCKKKAKSWDLAKVFQA